MLPRNALCVDLDGTLIDSSPGVLGALRHAISEMKSKPQSDAELRGVIGVGLVQVFRRLIDRPTQTRVDAAVDAFRDYYTAQGKREFKLYDGIVAALDAWRENDWPIYVVTSKPVIFAKQIIASCELRERVDGIVGAGLDERPSRVSKSRLLRKAIAKFGFDAQTSFMLGDREMDVRGALRQRMTALGAGWGYGGAAELRDAGAVHVFPTPAEFGSFRPSGVSPAPSRTKASLSANAILA